MTNTNKKITSKEEAPEWLRALAIHPGLGGLERWSLFYCANVLESYHTTLKKIGDGTLVEERMVLAAKQALNF